MTHLDLTVQMLIRNPLVDDLLPSGSEFFQTCCVVEQQLLHVCQKRCLLC